MKKKKKIIYIYIYIIYITVIQDVSTILTINFFFLLLHGIQLICVNYDVRLFIDV